MYVYVYVQIHTDYTFIHTSMHSYVFRFRKSVRYSLYQNSLLKKKSYKINIICNSFYTRKSTKNLSENATLS